MMAATQPRRQLQAVLVGVPREEKSGSLLDCAIRCILIRLAGKYPNPPLQLTSYPNLTSLTTDMSLSAVIPFAPWTSHVSLCLKPARGVLVYLRPLGTCT